MSEATYDFMMGEWLEPTMLALTDIAVERLRQIQKGYDAIHDDAHDGGEISAAAACYIAGTPNLRVVEDRVQSRALWPADWDWTAEDGGRTYRDRLIRAAAMLVAEVERIDRVKRTPVAPDSA